MAYVIGRTEPPPPAPLPAVVHLAPSDEEMIRKVRSDQAALLDQLRNNSDARKPQVASRAMPPAVPGIDMAMSASDLPTASTPVKPAKSASAVARRDERARLVDAKPRVKIEPRVEPRPEELLQVRPATGTDPAVRNLAQRDVPASTPAAPAPVEPAPAAEGDAGLTSTLKGITARLLPSRDRLPVPDQSALRPPMPVGEFQHSAM